MWYMDLAPLPVVRATPKVASALDCSTQVAHAIVLACKGAYYLGSIGKPYPVPVATQEALDLVQDAWREGLGRKDRLTVRIEASETQCECGSFDNEPHGDHEVKCGDCGEVMARSLTTLASGPFAEAWADADGYIDGSTWELCDTDMLYSCLTDRPELVEDLRSEGFALDLSDY